MKAVQEKAQATTSKRLAGKVALVTGGSRGIGEGIALRLAEEGADVVISYARSKSLADEVLAKISELNVRGAAFKADASAANEPDKLINDVIKTFGKIDILVNNAGVFERQSVEEMTLEHYDRVFDVNVKGVIATTIAAVKKLSEGGRIINISSVAAKGVAPALSVYSASKAAIDALTRIWAQDLGARHITVNAVSPGATASDMYNAVPEEFKTELIAKTSLGRVGQPADIAAVVAFLASDDGGWITGQSLIADGGLRI